MFPRRKLIYYLLLNIVVSACVTLSILYVYDSQYRTSASRDDRPSVSESGAQFEITTIIGAGMADSEVILIRNIGQSPADLMGWQISDEDGNVYTFNALSLPASAAIQLRTSAGKDSVIDLYWGLSAPVWHSGKTASLLDPLGNVRSVYQVP